MSGRNVEGGMRRPLGRRAGLPVMGATEELIVIVGRAGRGWHVNDSLQRKKRLNNLAEAVSARRIEDEGFVVDLKRRVGGMNDVDWAGWHGLMDDGCKRDSPWASNADDRKTAVAFCYAALRVGMDIGLIRVAILAFII